MRRAQAGFTLIETFVAITVLLTALAGPLTIASKGLQSAVLAKDQITAFYLSQDAVEYVRFKRDSNALAGAGWLAGLDACVDSLCKIDSKEDTVASCGAACEALRYDDSQGFFGYDIGDPATGYTRTVAITTVSATEVILAVTVAWRTGIFEREFTVKENLFDWQ